MMNDMSMEFDSKTGKVTGRMTRMTSEETKAFYERMKSDPGGVLGPPDMPLLNRMEKQRAKYGTGWGLKRLKDKLYGNVCGGVWQS